MERLLISGIDTLLGANLALAWADRFEVLGLAGRATTLAGCHIRTTRDEHDAATAVLDWQPRWIVHCGSLAAAGWENLPAEVDNEVPRVAQLVELAEQVSGRLTVISSDVVFRGPRLFHNEGAPATNPERRAALVREMEQAAIGHETLVVRTCAYGWSVDDLQRSFAQRAYDALVTGSAVPAPLLDGRRHATPILATDLAELLLHAYEAHQHGLWHIAGTERTSPHRFTTELAAALGVAVVADRSMPRDRLDLPAAETSLSSKRARRALATPTPMLREGIDRFVAQAENGWRDQLRNAAIARPAAA